MSRRWLRELGHRLGTLRNGRPIRRRLRIEQLEDRRVMAVGVDPFPGAIDLDLTKKPEFSVVGRFHSENEATVYHVRNAVGSGSESVRIIGFNPGEVDFKLEAFDLHGSPLAANDNSSGSDEPALTFDRLGHDEFFVRVTGRPISDQFDSLSEYFVRFAPYQDDHFAVAHGTPIELRNAPLNLAGNIEALGDTDSFQFRATTTTSLSINVSAVGIGGFDPNLIVRDSHNVVVAQNDNRATNSLASRASFQVQAGEVYNIAVSASAFTIPAGATGAYRVDVNPFADFVGDAADLAGSMTVNSRGEGRIVGVLEDGADRDTYRFTIPTSGVYQIETSTAQLAGLPILGLTRDDGTIFGTRIDDRLTRFNAQAGDVFLATIQTDALSSLPFDLRISHLTDDGNNQTDTAIPKSLSVGRSLPITDRIGFAGDVDFLEVIPSSGGIVTVQVAPGDFPLHLEIIDENARLLARGDGSVTFNLPDNVNFYLQVSALDRSTGSYSLSVSQMIEAVPNTLDRAVFLDLASRNVVREDRVDSPGDEDLYRIVAPGTGSYRVQLTPLDNGDALSDTVLTVLDSNGNQFGFNDDVDFEFDDLSSLLTLDLVQNQTYYVRAAGFDDLIGGYRLTISSLSLGADTVGNTFDLTAPPLMAVDHRLTITNAIQLNDLGDVFPFVAPTSATYRFRLQGDIATAVPLSDPILSLFDSDSNRTRLARNDDADGLNSRFEADLIQGRTYFVRAEGFSTTTGFYRLIIDDPNAPPMNSTRPALTLDSLGSTTFSDVLFNPNDTLDFRYRATFTGTLRVREDAATGSLLDSLVTVLEADGTTVIDSDDDGGGGTNSQLFFDVVAGRDYFIRAGGFETSTGAFVLRLNRFDQADDFSNEINKAARLLPIPDSNPVEFAPIDGVLERGGDVDYFSFMAPRTETVEIVQEARDGSGLDSLLQVFTSLTDSDPLMNDDSGDGLDSSITLTVIQGQTYYIRAGGYQQESGAFRVTVRSSPDDFGDTPATAQSLDLESPSRGATQGALRTSDDVDVFSFVALAGGSFQIRAFPLGQSSIVPVLTWLDADGGAIGFNNTSDSGDSILTISAAPGEVVYFQVEREQLFDENGDPIEGTTLSAVDSAYRIEAIQTYSDDAPNRVVPDAPTIPIAANGFGEQLGTLERIGDEDYYRIVAPFQGELSVLMKVAPDAFLDATLGVFDENGESIDFTFENGDPKPLDARIRFHVEAGETYFIHASFIKGERDETSVGRYQLLFQQARDTDSIQASLSTATPLDVSSTGVVQRSDTFANAADTNSFSYLAPETGTFTVTVTPTHGSALDPLLSVYRFEPTFGQFVLVGRNDNRQPGISTSEVTFNVLEGDELVFYLDTPFGSSPVRQGSYQLQVTPTPFLDEVSFDPASAEVLDLSIFDEAQIQDRQVPAVPIQGVIETSFDQDRYRLTPSSSDFYQLFPDTAMTVAFQAEVFDDAGNLLRPIFFEAGGFVPVYFLFANVQYDVLIGGRIDSTGAFDQPRSTGSYSFTFRPDRDDFSGFDPTPLQPTADGSASIVGLHEFSDDVDVFSYTASTDGQVQITLGRVAVPGNLDLFDPNDPLVFDPTHLLHALEVTGDDPFDNTFGIFDPVAQTIHLTREVRAGEVLQIETNSTFGSGLYQLSVSAPIGNRFDDATPISLGDDLSLRIPGEINTPDDVDTFRLVAPRTGTLRVRLNSDFLFFEPELTRLLANGDEVSGQFGSSFASKVLTLNVTAGEVIVLQASSADSFTGHYSLIFTYEKNDTSVSGATTRNVLVQVDPVSRIGRFTINPDAAGVVGLTVIPRNGNADGQVSVRVHNEQFDVIGSSSSDIVQQATKLQYNVFEGESTIVELKVPADVALTTGQYLVQVLFTPGSVVSSTPSNVIQPIEVIPRPTESLIPQAGMTQVRSFVATQSGLTTLQFNSATPLSVGIWDAENQLMASSTTASSQLSFNATARETYFLRVRSPDDTATLAGNFSVQLVLDDRPSTPPPPMIVTPQQPVVVPGVFNAPGDRDAFGITVGGSSAGLLTIRFIDAPGRGLDPTLQLVGLAGGTVSFAREMTVRVASGSDLSLILSDGSGVDFAKFDLAMSFVEDDLIVRLPGDVDPGNPINPNNPLNPNGFVPNNQLTSGNDQPPSNQPNASSILSLFSPNPFIGAQAGNDAASLVFSASEGNSELLLATLIIGVVGDAGFPIEEGVEDVPPTPGYDDEIERRLDDISAGVASNQSLLGRFNGFIYRFLQSKNLSSDLMKLQEYLRTPEGQAELVALQGLLAEVDRMRRVNPGLDLAAEQIIDFVQTLRAEASPDRKPAPKPNVLDDFLTTDPMKQSAIPVPESRDNLVSSLSIDKPVRLSTSTLLTVFLLGALTMNTDRETFWRLVSSSEPPQDSRRKRPESR